MIETICKRPILRYHGGKWMLSKWIISHFPEHRVYTEAFGGAASVLLRKKRAYAEIYNDIDHEVVNLFKVVREKGSILKEMLLKTPFSREEFNLSYQSSNDSIEQARRTVIRSFMGFSSGLQPYKTGFRSNSNRSGSTPASDWRNYPDALEFIIDRLQGVVIENKSAFEILKRHDSKETLHYVDPPYVLDTRYKGQKSKMYYQELRNEDHLKLCELLKSLKGTVILSGYPNVIYDYKLSNWKRIERKAYADGARKRTEVLWINRK